MDFTQQFIFLKTTNKQKIQTISTNNQTAKIPSVREWAIFPVTGAAQLIVGRRHGWLRAAAGRKLKTKLEMKSGPRDAVAPEKLDA